MRCCHAMRFPWTHACSDNVDIALAEKQQRTKVTITLWRVEHCRLKASASSSDCRSAVHPTNSTTQLQHLQEEASVCGPFGHIAWGAVSMLRLQVRRALLPTRFWTRSLHARLVVHWPRIIRYTR